MGNGTWKTSAGMGPKTLYAATLPVSAMVIMVRWRRCRRRRWRNGSLRRAIFTAFSTASAPVDTSMVLAGWPPAPAC
ncbi:MAG: hypothetical protein U1F35_17655 [Steroidobacteraceae bacterium]